MLSAANASLYGVLHSAVAALGCSPGLGFVHTGHAHAFVHDMADLYKASVTIPAAFDAVAAGRSSEAAARHAVRNYARDHDLLASVVADIYDLLWEPEQPVLDEQAVEDDGPLLWDDDGSAGRSATLTGGSNYVTDPSMP